MTTSTIATALILAVAHAAAAQTPARPADTPRTVTLPLAEYNRLTDLANRPPQDPPLAPVAAVVASADVRVRVDRESVRGVFTMTGDVLRPGINRVPLLSGATLLDATLDGAPVPLVADANAHAALLPGPGPFSLAADWAGALTVTPGRASFVLPVPLSGTARATFDLPGEQADVKLSAGLVTRRTAAGGRTLVEATLVPGVSTQVSWSMRDSAPVAAAREVRTLGDVFTLITLGDSDVRMVALLDVTVVQGEPRTVGVSLPDGYEVTRLEGNTLEASEQRDGTLRLTVSDPTVRRHQFLVSLERPHESGSFTLTTGLVALPDVQRERGEIAVEGIGTLEATGADREGLTRIDARELNPALRRLARNPLLSAWRYQGALNGPPQLALDVSRFGDVGVLAAVADRARATTVVTSEGRALTEIALLIQNRAQPFLKVTLPPGAAIVSVEVAGESAKPAIGIDGTRVPLLRPRFRPTGPYPVSFVYLHTGAPFARRGNLQMLLPRMDIPIGLLEWEVFVPNRYAVRQVGGNVMDGNLAIAQSSTAVVSPPARSGSCTSSNASAAATPGTVGAIAGSVQDTNGGALPGVTIEVSSTALVEKVRTTSSDANGRYLIAALPAGSYCVSFALQGFRTLKRENVQLSPGTTTTLRAEMRVGAVSTSVNVVAEAPVVDVQTAGVRQVFQGNDLADLPTRRDVPGLIQLVPGLTEERLSGICAGGNGVFCNATVPVFNSNTGTATGIAMDTAAAPNGAAGQSQNVVNLQRRVAGVLPVRINVPRAGTSHWFLKPLVVDQEAAVTLKYKRQ